jgi:hypothetical protein
MDSQFVEEANAKEIDDIVASIDKSCLKTKEDELLVFFANHGTFID